VIVGTEQDLVHDVRAIDPLDVARFGGKAAGLARMHRLGLPVPPAFVIDTRACARYQSLGAIPADLQSAVDAALDHLQLRTGKRFAGNRSGGPPGGGSGTPLLVSVRSGAQISMPGMMDTVLNLGLDRNSVLELAAASADPAFAVATWAKFWSMFADIVLDVDPEWLTEQTARQRDSASASLSERSAGELEAAILRALEEEGRPAPTDPRAQLTAAISAVFASWDSRRATLYREHHGIPHDLGTAVTVQAMVFGNLGAPAGSGVAFTRDPKTGDRELFGEYLPGGQGEDVVAGTRTPVSLTDPTADWLPLVSELHSFGDRLEAEYADALDIEFTAEAGRLYLLQVRPAKRTAAAAVHIAVDLMRENVIDGAEALRRVSVEQIKHLVAPEFDEDELALARQQGRVLTVGIPASPGHGSGRAVLDADRAGVMAAAGDQVILLRPTTSPQDLRGMLAAQAVVTARGGATSHAAVVSRALDKPCVVGCEHLQVRPDERVFVIDGREFAEGQEISVDGSTGEVLAGIVSRSVPHRNLSSLTELLDRADARSGCRVWSKVVNPAGAAFPVETGSPGLAIVSLTDLLVSSGGVADLIGAIGAYSAAPDAPAADVEDVVERIGYQALQPLLTASVGLPVHVRVPTMTSPRARSWIHEWTALAPHLLVPLGPARLLTAYIRAITAAARDTGHQHATLLIGGITDAAELTAFAEMVGTDAPVRVGAVLQNPVVLHHPDALVRAGHDLWVDLAELVRTACGRPDELLYLTGDLATSPAGSAAPAGAVLPALIADQLAGLVGAAAAAGSGTAVGVEVAGHANPALTAALFGLGIRRFTSTAGQAEELRLALGQLADRED
jgi:pyruvate,orthophosphate dikinase